MIGRPKWFHRFNTSATRHTRSPASACSQCSGRCRRSGIVRSSIPTNSGAATDLATCSRSTFLHLRRRVTCRCTALTGARLGHTLLSWPPPGLVVLVPGIVEKGPHVGEGVDDLVDYSLDRGRAVQRGTLRTTQFGGFPFPDNTGGRADLQHCTVRDLQSIAPCRLHRGGRVSMHVGAC